MSDYRRMPIAAKRAAAIASQREPAVACPGCGAHVMPADLLAHVASRCTGRPEPHPASAWLTVGEATALGVTHETVERWLQRGLVRVRVRGAGDERQVLARDLVQLIAMLRVLEGSP